MDPSAPMSKISIKSLLNQNHSDDQLGDAVVSTALYGINRRTFLTDVERKE